MQARRVGDAVELGDRLGRRAELGGDPDQRVAGLDLVGPRRRRRRPPGAERTRRRAGAPASAGPALGPASAVGPAVGRAVAAALAVARWPRASARRRPRRRRAAAGQRWPGRSPRRRAPRRTTRTAWPDRPIRAEGRASSMAIRPWSRTTGVVRASGRGRVGGAVVGRSAGRRGRPRTSRRSTWSAVRHSRRCFSAASGAGGATAPQRCSRATVELRQAPSAAARYGQMPRQRRAGRADRPGRAAAGARCRGRPRSWREG